MNLRKIWNVLCILLLCSECFLSDMLIKREISFTEIILHNIKKRMIKLLKILALWLEKKGAGNLKEKPHTYTKVIISKPQ